MLRQLIPRAVVELLCSWVPSVQPDWLKVGEFVLKIWVVRVDGLHGVLVVVGEVHDRMVNVVGGTRRWCVIWAN